MAQTCNVVMSASVPGAAPTVWRESDELQAPPFEPTKLARSMPLPRASSRYLGDVLGQEEQQKRHGQR
jgi:hypothetical protein